MAQNPSETTPRSVRKIGLISDTHGLLREEALRALHASDLIIHAGDVGDSKVLEALREIAPVVAVRGNVDTAEWARSLKRLQRGCGSDIPN